MINVSILGDRQFIEAAITALAEPWGEVVVWDRLQGVGPHAVILGTVRLDLLFVPAADESPEAPAVTAGAIVRISYHGTPAGDHLAAIAAALAQYAGVLATDRPAGWPVWA